MESEVLRLIDERGPKRVREAIRQSLLPSVRLEVRAAGRAEPGIGRSRVGGLPDLPAGLSWPRRIPGGAPLSFLAQFNLAEVAPYDPEGRLPRQGMLWFFYDAEEQPWGFDPADRGAWRVIYADVDPAGLVRLGSPEALGTEWIFREATVGFRRELTLPPLESGFVQGLNLSREERGRYMDLEEAVHRLYGGENIHRLLGHPQPIQGDMQLECQLVSHGLYCGTSEGYQDPQAEALRPGAADWRLLFQLDSDFDATGMMWGDVGRLYFWIREQDLRERRFADVWMVLQCS